MRPSLSYPSQNKVSDLSSERGLISTNEGGISTTVFAKDTSTLTQHEQYKAEIMAAEMAFVKMAGEEGLPKAFLHFAAEDAEEVADFITPCLNFDPKERAMGIDCLNSDWLQEENMERGRR